MFLPNISSCRWKKSLRLEPAQGLLQTARLCVGCVLAALSVRGWRKHLPHNSKASFNASASRRPCRWVMTLQELRPGCGQVPDISAEGKQGNLSWLMHGPVLLLHSQAQIGLAFGGSGWRLALSPFRSSFSGLEVYVWIRTAEVFVSETWVAAGLMDQTYSFKWLFPGILLIWMACCLLWQREWKVFMAAMKKHPFCMWALQDLEGALPALLK